MRQAKLVMASLAMLTLAACGNAASPINARTAPASQQAATAKAGASMPSNTPSSPAASAPTPVTIQAVGSAVIRYWLQHQAGIGDYSLVQDDVVTGAKCVTLFSNKAVADAVKSQMAQMPAALNEPFAEVTACGTENLTTGGGTIVGLASVQLSVPAGPDDLLSVNDTLLNGTWTLIARKGTQQVVHPVQLSPAQVADTVNRAFADATAHLPSDG